MSMSTEERFVRWAGACPLSRSRVAILGSFAADLAFLRRRALEFAVEPASGTFDLILAVGVYSRPRVCQLLTRGGILFALDGPEPAWPGFVVEVVGVGDRPYYRARRKR